MILKEKIIFTSEGIFKKEGIEKQKHFLEENLEVNQNNRGILEGRNLLKIGEEIDSRDLEDERVVLPVDFKNLEVDKVERVEKEGIY